MPRLRLLPPAEAVLEPEQTAPVMEYLMRRGGPIAIDTETTGLNIIRDRIIYWSMATEDRRFFFPYELLSRFAPLFERADISWYLANAKYDQHMLANHGHPLVGKLKDIIVMDAMDDDTRPHGLKDQSFIHFGVRWAEYKELFLDTARVAETLGYHRRSALDFKKRGAGERLETVFNERPDLVIDYATCDAYFTYLLAEQHMRVLAASQTPNEVLPAIVTQLDYFELIEVPLTRTLWNMERRGVAIDEEYVKSLRGPMQDGLAAARAKINAILGMSFDPRSKDDLREILFGKSHFALKPTKITGAKAGVATSTAPPKPSVQAPELKALRARVPNDGIAAKFLDAYMEWAKLDKLYGTYVENILDLRSDDGRVHATFNQAVARTTRLSSSNPNLQNIPVRSDDWGIRGIFIAGSHRDGQKRVLVSRDYPQIEFRVAAALAGEEQMMASIRAGWDIHSSNAARMYGPKHPGVTYEAIEEARRKKGNKEPLTSLDLLCLKCREGAKVIGLGTMYGEGRAKIAQDLGCSLDEAQAQIDQFFDSNPQIVALINYMHALAEEDHITHTWLGRIRRLHRVGNHFNRGVVAAELRQAFNMLIQGSSAEMIKLAMLQIDNSQKFRELGGELLLQVHDELISEVPERTRKRCESIIDKKMSRPYNWKSIVLDFPVPVTPDGGYGHRWSDLK